MKTKQAILIDYIPVPSKLCKGIVKQKKLGQVNFCIVFLLCKYAQNLIFCYINILTQTQLQYRLRTQFRRLILPTKTLAYKANAIEKQNQFLKKEVKAIVQKDCSPKFKILQQRDHCLQGSSTQTNLFLQPINSLCILAQFLNLLQMQNTVMITINILSITTLQVQHNELITKRFTHCCLQGS